VHRSVPRLSLLRAATHFVRLRELQQRRWHDWTVAKNKWSGTGDSKFRWTATNCLEFQGGMGPPHSRGGFKWERKRS
jgi:hypothetical protein